MESKAVVAVDVDGILANFYLAACRKFNLPYDLVTQFYMEGLEFDKIVNDYEFWNNLPTLSPPESFTFDFDKYLTSIPKGMEKARINWLSKNGYPNKPMVASHNKAPHCVKHGIHVLIDDKPNTIKECINSGIFAIQFVPYYSQMPLMTKIHITHLSQAKAIIELVDKYVNIESSLPEAVRKDLLHEFHSEGIIRFENLLNYCKSLFHDNTTSDEIIANVSRWKTNGLRKYHKWLYDEKVLGEDRYHGVMVLIDLAKESL